MPFEKHSSEPESKVMHLQGVDLATPSSYIIPPS